MLRQVLITPLREQAGARSYNRYEYQAAWSVFHIVGKYEQRDFDFLVLFEFHDDVAEAKSAEDPECLRFFQVKTKKDSRPWSIRDLTSFSVGRNGVKHSFLGYIFYNFLQFGRECERCSFVSNQPFDHTLNAWQSCIKDGNSLAVYHPDIYSELFSLIRAEFPNVEEDEFRSAFDTFCQSTYLEESDLALQGYEDQIRGHFAALLRDRLDVSVGTANSVLDEIWNLVRRKFKREDLPNPISLTELIRRKGVTGRDLQDITRPLERRRASAICGAIVERFHSRPALASQLVKQVQLYRRKRLDTSDTLYQDLVAAFAAVSERLINRYIDIIDNADLIESLLGQEIHQFMREHGVCHPLVTEVHLKGVFYDTLYSGLESEEL